MNTTTSDRLLQRLHQWGVRRVFGYPGHGINGLLGAFDRMGERMQFVQARHEERAAFMATAHAKFTGEVGACVATSGPGAIHLLNGLYDAKADHQPVLAIVGQTARAAMGGDYQQEVDLGSLFKDVAHEYQQTAMVPAQIRHLVDRAMRIARDQRTATCLIVLPAFPYAQYAKSLGLHGIRVTDPNVPPLPPHVSAKQAKAYARAMVHGDPQALGTMITTAREWWDSVTGCRRERH